MTPIARRNVVGSLFALALTLTASLASAQMGEFPNLKGDSDRTGRNENPLNTGPGLGKLNWFAPFGAVNTTTIILDNTAVADTSGYLGGPYDPPTYGLVSPIPPYVPQRATYDSNKEWAGPKVDEEASFPYLQVRRGVNTTTGLQPDSSRRDPAYAFTRCVPSDTSGDPTQAAVPKDRRYFQWIFRGPAGGTRYYSIYAWLPIGSTKVGATRIFPQRYFVYEVIYGSGQRFVDVVDTYASGGGFIKLGNGGKPTNAVFPYDGANPIRVRLYNTVPRDETGTLTMPTPVTNYCVYADAMKAAPGNGSIDSTPTTNGFGDASARTTVAVNTVSTSIQNGQTLFNTRGVVSSYLYNFQDSVPANNLKWTFSPFAGQNGEGDRDNESTDTTADPSWTVVNSGKFLNGSYLENTLITAGTPTAVTYAPNLTPGEYEIYAYIPGNYPGKRFGARVTYEVDEGTTTSSRFTVDQRTNVGWVRIGTKKFTNTTANRLKLKVLNLSSAPNDAGLKVFADGIRFVNSGNQGISSTPVHASIRLRLANGNLAIRKVVIVADESGHIHCLDAQGLADGTTTEYWQYPSRRRSDTYIDPNFTEGIDAKNVPAPTPDTISVAEMPTGFNLSTAIVERIAGLDYLYIASTNGRIYCIEMAGRGDFNVAGRTPGTARRVWSFPDDFPSANPQASTLGAFTGSLAFGRTATGLTIFAPTQSGRVYALDALPQDSTNKTNRTTTTRWTFPALDEPTLGPITMTPTYEFGVLLVGTGVKDDQPGRFYALSGRNGKPQWVFPSDAQISNPAVDEDIRSMGSFVSSPATATAALLGGAMTNTVFVMNENQYVYALPVDGTTDRLPVWKTNELGTGAVGSLGFTAMTVYDKNLTLQPNTPVVMVPTSDGRFDGLFARTGDVNRANGRRCYEYVAAGDSITASMAFSRGYMYGADNAGYVYAFSNIGGAFGSEWGTVPGEEGIVENDPAGDRFRETKIALITRDGYTKLRQPLGSVDHLTYAQATSPAYSFTRNPFAFEWGETVYVMVYDFPGATQDPNGRIVPPPIVNVSFNVEGQTVRSIPVESQLFEQPNTAPTNAHDPSLKNDSYAVLAFTFQGGGPNALPPGNAEISVSISTQSLNGRQAFQNVALDPNLARKPFLLANPLGIAVQVDNSAIPQGIANQGVGLSVFPDNPQNLVNGSANVVSGATPRPAGDRISDSVLTTTDESRVMTSAGNANHGQSKTARVFIYDRSMMGLIRPDNRGLDNVRIMLDDLAWQGGRSTIYKSLSSILYPNFEDAPGNYPNTSLDYPDIKRDSISVAKDPNGDAENPVNTGVALLPPVKANGDPLDEDTRPEDRRLRPTIFDVTINVPRFQPPNNAFATGSNPPVPIGSGATSPGDPRYRQVDSSGATNVIQGYLGRLSVFVDTTQNGILETSSREAYRSFNVATAVLPDERISVITPNVDPSTKNPTLQLGSLAGGSGYTNDGTNNPFSPLSANYGDLFKDFQVQNEGNMNLLDVRLAKASRNVYPNSPFGSFVPEQFYSPENEDQSWLDGTLDLWANFDSVFAPTYGPGSVNRQIIQKARVGDSVPTALVVNPSRRTNPNLAVAASPAARRLVPGLPDSKPAVSVTVPFGFPVGRYSQSLRVIENSVASDDTWDRFNTNTVETFSDPQFDVSFTVRETRLTNSYTQKTAPLIDDYDTSSKNLFSNTQPAALRDAAGSLLVAWSSNRPTDSAALPSVPSLTSSSRIFLASLDNAAGFIATRINPPTSASNFLRSLSPGATGYTPLRDLDFFTPDSSTRWFKKAAGSANGFPDSGIDLKSLFGATGTGESIAANTDKFGNPSFPANGVVNPFRNPNSNRTANGNLFTSVYMAFTGEAQKVTPTGRELISRLFLTTVGMSTNGTISGLGSPIAMPYDDFTTKGKPAVVQTSNGAMVFYPATSNGTGTINYTRFNGSTFTPPTGLAFGDGFESVFAPSVAARYKNGVTTTPILEFTFSGKLRGRTSADLFLGRIALDQGTLHPTENADGTLVSNVFADQPARSKERVTPLDNGSYAARGVQWNRTQPIALIQNINGTETDLLVPGTQTFDRESGIITYESRLGGSVSFDPTLGTIKFNGTTPSRSAILRLTYTPKFVRISEAGSVASNGTNGVFDDRTISDFNYWTLASGNVADASSNIKNDRMIFTYVRGAGAGSGARPYLATYRFGLRLPTPVYTNDSGAVVNLSVTGNVGPYQVDPSNGRVYFTAADEDRSVSITYVGADVGTGAQLTGQFASGSVSLIQERSEAPILIEQALNESNVSTFIDPFDFTSSDFRVRRPALTWMFWTSNRAGYPDIYFETIAPRLSPLPLSK